MSAASCRARKIWRAAMPAALVITAVSIAATAADAAPFVAISGSGSSWASIAIDQWSQDVRSSGMVVNYNPDGSAAGRSDFIAGQDDYAVSDVPFRNGHDKLGHTQREVVPWDYSYIPCAQRIRR